MIVPVMAISNLVLTRQIYSEETNGAHAHYREPVLLISQRTKCLSNLDVIEFQKFLWQPNWANFGCPRNFFHQIISKLDCV